MMVVKVPIENSNDALGCRKAGNLIISNFPRVYNAENKEEIEKANLNLEEIHLDNSNIKEANKLIYDNAIEIIGNNEKIVFLGGDQSMTYGIGKAFMEVCNSEGKEPFLIVFDAHADVSEYSDKIPKNNQWLRALINEGFRGENIILVGLRVSSKDKNDFLEESKIRVYRMRDLNNYEEICDIIMELSRKGEIYLSIDVDVVDSTFVPGTAHGESAGMTSRQLIYFIQRINLLKNLRVIDISEINPDLDFKEQTIKLGVKILGEILS
ncbi:MAG: arginase family protein [Candidatus Pacearchaeota archaeon]